jgi:hypothetical protein
MAHPDINELLKTPMGLPFAKQLLKQYGEFYPFGVSMALSAPPMGMSIRRLRK